jgi:hypothetical protein
MANYYGNARSNYFRVKDDEAFIDAMENIPSIELIHEENGTFVILGDDPDGAGWPSWAYDEENDTDIEIDLPAVVSEHLADGEVAIFMESGAEKLRYIVGYAEAINNKGERREVSLNSIYELAGELTDRPKDITTAEY